MTTYTSTIPGHPGDATPVSKAFVIRCGGMSSWRAPDHAFNPLLSMISLAPVKEVSHFRSETRQSSPVEPFRARLSAVIGSRNETMPTTENGTVRITSQRPRTKRPTLRVVGEAAGPPRRQRNSELRPREYL